MKSQTSHMKLHHSWFRPRTPRSVDKIGVAFALAFLVAITALAGGRGEKTIDKDVSEEWPVVSTQVDYRLQAETSYDSNFTRSDRAITPLRNGPEDTALDPPTIRSH